MDEIKDLIANNHLETSTRLTALETKLSDVPERLKKLEETRTWAKGAWATLSFIIGSIATYLGMKH